MHLHQHLLWQPNKRIRKCTSNIIPGQSSLALRVLHGRKSRESENELLLPTLCTPHAASWTVFPVHSTSGLPLLYYMTNFPILAPNSHIHFKIEKNKNIYWLVIISRLIKPRLPFKKQINHRKHLQPTAPQAESHYALPAFSYGCRKVIWPSQHGLVAPTSIILCAEMQPEKMDTERLLVYS